MAPLVLVLVRIDLDLDLDLAGLHQSVVHCRTRVEGGEHSPLVNFVQVQGQVPMVQTPLLDRPLRSIALSVSVSVS